MKLATQAIIPACLFQCPSVRLSLYTFPPANRNGPTRQVLVGLAKAHGLEPVFSYTDPQPPYYHSGQELENLLIPGGNPVDHKGRPRVFRHFDPHYYDKEW